MNNNLGDSKILVQCPVSDIDLLRMFPLDFIIFICKFIRDEITFSTNITPTSSILLEFHYFTNKIIQTFIVLHSTKTAVWWLELLMMHNF